MNDISSTNAMIKMEEDASTQIKIEECCNQNCNSDMESKGQLLKQQILVEQQQRDIKVMA